MARRVYDIYLYVAMHYGAVLGIYGYSSFSLYVVAVHNAVGHFFVGSENAALIEESVYQRGFACVYVGYHSDIDYLLLWLHIC